MLNPCCSDFDGGVGAVAPFGPGTVVVAGVGVAEELEDEGAVRRTDSGLSMGVDALVGGDAVVLQDSADFIGGLEQVGPAVDELQPFEMNGAGDAAGPAVAAGCCPFVFASASYVPDYDLRVRHVFHQHVGGHHHGIVQPGGEGDGGRVSRGEVGDGAAFGEPLAPAAVHHLHVGVTVVVECPPEAGGVEAAGVVVGNDQGVVADTEGFGELLEVVGAKDVQAVGVRVLLVVVLLEDRAGDVGAHVLVGNVAVHDADARVFQVLAQPIRAGQEFGVYEVGPVAHHRSKLAPDTSSIPEGAISRIIVTDNMQQNCAGRQPNHAKSGGSL